MWAADSRKERETTSYGCGKLLCAALLNCFLIALLCLLIINESFYIFMHIAHVVGHKVINVTCISVSEPKLPMDWNSVLKIFNKSLISIKSNQNCLWCDDIFYFSWSWNRINSDFSCIFCRLKHVKSNVIIWRAFWSFLKIETICRNFET